MEKRSAFPPVFWAANIIEVLERFAYYGIYFGFGIFMQSRGFDASKLGTVQGLFLLFSYTIPVISGTFADRFGFKKVLIVSCLAYLPSILLLLFTKSFEGIAMAMVSIGIAAGIFKPLISGTVRAVSDKTNATLGFGIFYAMVNIGGSFGPIVAGKLRAISWDYVFIAAAITIVLMLLITIVFYKEPKREIEGATLKQKFREIYVALSDKKFALFLFLLGVFFWLPFWAFFNLMALYIDKNLDTARLYQSLSGVFGTGFANIFSHVDESGTRRILGETISHTGYIIMIFQIFVSRITEKTRAIPTFLTGLFIASVGLAVSGYARISDPSLIFAGIAMFAIGEMISSPRIQEYITWLAPKEKAGLYMGSNFLATGIGGALSKLYTDQYGRFNKAGHAEYVWYTLAAHFIIGILVIFIFTKSLGEFKEVEQ
jgi:POT family proton-dependent oligopeptide transporter